MIKVITYGTFDLLHYGHIKLLERAKQLGDYLIVGITTDDFDRNRGKINVKQSLIERVKAVQETGLADEIIIEEYQGQKIDDIISHSVDIFAIGSDWEGKFDYLNEYCKVIYLSRTEGISSSKIRSQNREIKLAIVGDEESFISEKFLKESEFVNGVKASIIKQDSIYHVINEFDAYYLVSNPKKHYEQIKLLLENKKHVLCESPISTKLSESIDLYSLAKKNNCYLMDGIKTAFSTAYSRLILQAKSGEIGNIVSIDVTCTSMRQLMEGNLIINESWNSICAWGPTAMLPIFQLLGTDYKDIRIISKSMDENKEFDAFTKIEFIYDNAVASVKVGKAVKSEGELIISGTNGYIYVPSPWWKTDYYEIRREDFSQNTKQFYKLEGEGIREEILTFKKNIESNNNLSYINVKISEAICNVIEKFYKGEVLYLN